MQDEDWSARSRAHIFICNRRPKHEQSDVSGIYASEVPRAEDFDARRGNKREGEWSVSTYVTDPESRNYPKYCAKDSSEGVIFC